MGQIEQAALAVNPHTRIAIVSHHGFLRVDHHTNLNVLLAQAGLIQLASKPNSPRPSVVNWQAEAWPAGGMNAIVLKNPDLVGLRLTKPLRIPAVCVTLTETFC